MINPKAIDALVNAYLHRTGGWETAKDIVEFRMFDHMGHNIPDKYIKSLVAEGLVQSVAGRHIIMNEGCALMKGVLYTAYWRDDLWLFLQDKFVPYWMANCINDDALTLFQDKPDFINDIQWHFLRIYLFSYAPPLATYDGVGTGYRIGLTNDGINFRKLHMGTEFERPVWPNEYNSLFDRP
jgi:hypothetical protein